MNLSLFYEDLLFIVTATSFFIGVGWTWRKLELYDLPQSLPYWFRIWFLTVQLGGIGLPLLGLVWSIQKGYFNVVMILASYFLLLVLQILTEFLSLRWFHFIVFVMVPYLYLPYRIWQLYKGLILLNPTDDGNANEHQLGVRVRSSFSDSSLSL